MTVISVMRALSDLGHPEGADVGAGCEEDVDVD
jgi:hypothetical protein